MNNPQATDQVGELVAVSLRTIVPDIDPAVIDGDAPLQEEAELDSLDFLAFVAQLSKRSGLRIEEDDYGELGTFTGCIDYLRRRLGGQG
ncbi:phosphopantetheine-binding protein [Haloechinothrix sp. LS1_15]|uniref:acyl carrier protein n=1 Tax=Haloechinothrix sp. LS1_15 TaxID=2652248 RepID=UPI002945952D|nr:phosphopantetheine-binding protein [Haloechinothrix sp. LS1_15]MDV6014252.1 acyl carrier protein [Haloechinothrix sp. LS1_15]